jgi:hypothetical protein
VLGGIPGLLLSVPAAAVVKVVWNFFYPRLATQSGPEPAPASDEALIPTDSQPDGARLAEGKS